MNYNVNIRDRLKARGLKVTPQRMRVLEAVYKLNNHPTADAVLKFIRKKDPNISSGTVYKVLETLVENELINRVRTDKGIMRYEGVSDHHHHLYCRECDKIEDYVNEKLDEVLREFFEKNKIDDFSIEDITVNINGYFTD